MKSYIISILSLFFTVSAIAQPNPKLLLKLEQNAAELEQKNN